MPAALLAQNWNQQSPATSPPARDGAAMVYDPVNHLTVLFGGENTSGVAQHDTWIYDGTTWTNVTPAVGQPNPAVRLYHSLVYDATDGYILLFGGCSDNTCSTPLSDTWKLTGSGTTFVWTNLAPSGAPSARYGASMAYSSSPFETGVYLFGGADYTGTPMQDMWLWSGGTWSNLPLGLLPPARLNASMSYDPVNQQIVLFGGLGSTALLNDTWVFTEGLWSPASPSNPPSARSTQGQVYDPVRQRTVLFGGSANSDTWLWDGVNWTQETTLNSPSGRSYVDLAYDIQHAQTVLFGGELTSSPASDVAETWTLGYIYTQSWMGVDAAQDPSVPSARLGAAGVAYGNDFLIFGGYNGTNTVNDTWTFTGDVWGTAASGGPSARAYPSMAYDGLNSLVLLFGGGGTGGFHGSNFQGDTWTFSNGSWTPLSPNTSPTPREGAAMAYDAANLNVVLFGGFGGGSGNDTWTWGGNDWTAVETAPPQTPAGRDGASMVFDYARNQIMMFGGLSNASSSALNDTWVWNGSNWAQLSPANSPPARGYASMVYDSIHGTVLLFGGQNAGGDLSDTWQWDGVNWTQLTAPGMPSVTDSAAAAFVAPIGFVIFGGSNSGAPNSSTVTFGSPYVPNDQNAFFPNVIDFGVGYNSQFFSYTISPSGGVGPYTFHDDGVPNSLASSGLSLDPNSGQISGFLTLAAGQNLSYGIQITDAQGQTIHLSFELKVDANISFAPNPPPDATASAGYAYSVAVATGGTPPFTYSISGAPSWLTLNPITGALVGTNCSASTTAQYSLGVTDSVGGTASSGPFTINCNPAPLITTTSLPSPMYGVGYSAGLATNAVYDPPGASPYTWTLQSGSSLPPGLTLQSSGFITGTPTAVGASTFTVIFTDAWGAFNTKKLNITVALDITNTQLATGNVGIGYATGQTIIATGGTGPYTFQAANMPPGLAISGTGTITGTPTTTGNYTPTFTATDSVNNQGSLQIPLFVVQPGTNPEDWYQLSPSTLLQIRSDVSMFYDSVRNKLVMFGGSGPGDLGDTDVWNGTNWTNVANSGPSPRYGAAAAFDPVHQVGVLFGGNDGTYENDTWTWDGTTWTQANPATVPGGRWNASMAWDGKHIVMYGGSVGDGDFGDTWIWDGTNWTQLSPENPPSNRAGAGMTYDTVNNKVVMFGGFDVEAGDYGDTWLWDGTAQTWTEAATTGPSARDSLTLAFDPVHGNTILYGGENDGVPSNDTWVWNGTAWSQLNVLHNPGPRFCYGMAFDPATSNILLFGGDDPNLSLTYENDTWILEGPAVTGGTMPAGVEGSVYSGYTPTETGGIAPLAYSATGTPAGISVNASTGAFGGTPTVAGPFSITDIVVDNFGVSSSASLSLAVSSPGLQLSPTTLPNATQNANYIVPLSASGGAGGYIFSATGLPAGLSVSSTDIVGQCTASSSNVVLKVTDSASNSATVGPLTVTCNPYPAITTTSPLPGGFTNTPYSTTIQMTGGTPAISWTLTQGTLPNTFSLNQSGVLSGSSTSPFVANFSVSVIDSWGATSTQNFSLTVANVINFTNTQLPLGNVNVVYPGATLTATGGMPPYQFSAANLPPGLQLNSSSGAISGTPTAAGNYNPQFTISDQGDNVTQQNFAMVVGAPGTYTQDWVQLSPAFSPGVRFDASVFYDSVRNKVIMFGGDLFSGLTDTEQWDGTNWTTLHPATSPSGRFGAAAAFDPAHQVGVLFGGQDTSGLRNDTWTWNGTNWTQINPANSPSARLDAMMAWDGTHIVLFGGSILTAADDDTWIWDGTNWTQVTTATPPNAPSARDLSGIAYDSGHNQVVLFGGSPITSNTNFDDTWIWNGANQTWTLATPANTPGARAFMSMAYDPTHAKTFLFGGFEPPNNPQSDTWAWDGTNWTQVNTPHAPTGGRDYYAMAFDPTTSNTLLFGGNAGNTLNDTWVLDGPTAPNTTLPSGVVNTPYSGTGTIAGGIAPFTYIAGTLPPGMNFNASNDSFGGTPTAANSYTIPVTVQDAWGVSIVPQFAVTIAGSGLTLSPNTLPNATAQTNYNVPLSATGGTPAYTFSATGLPAGLSINANNQIVGQCTASSANVTLKVTDSASNTATVGPLSVTCNPLPAITTTSPLPPGLTNTPYSTTIQMTGGTPVITWTLTPGNLPANFSINQSGVLTGTAFSALVATFSVTVTDIWNATSTQQFQLTINNVINFTNTQLPLGNVNVQYPPATLAATGGQPPYFFTVQNLPPGLQLNPNTGAITGTPTTAGNYNPQFSVSDQGDNFTQQNYAIVVAPIATNMQDWVQLSPSSSPGVRYGAATFFDATRLKLIIFGGANPTGLNDTVMWDGANWTTLSPASSPSPRIGAVAAFDPIHQQGVLFGGETTGFATMNDTWLWNGTTWTQASPTNKPAAAAYASMTWDGNHIMLYDDDGSTWIWDGANWTQVAIGASPPARTGAGIAYNPNNGHVVMFGGNTGSGPVAETWIWNGGNLTWTQQTPAHSPQPRYLHVMAFHVLETEIILFGGVLQPEAYPADTWIWDGVDWSQVNTPHSPAGRIDSSMAFDNGTSQFVLFGGEIGFGGFANDTWVLDAPVGGGRSLPAGAVGVPYNYTITLIGGISPQTEVASNLPPGMSFNGTTGTFGGIPTQAGSYTGIPVYVQDAQGVSVETTYSVTINAAPALTIVSPTTLPNGTTGQAYNYTLQWSGGVGKVTVSATNLPQWLFLAPGTGALSGTPPAGGVYTFSITVTDSQNPTPNTASQQETIVVSAPAITTASPLPPAYIGIAYTENLGANSGTSPYSWTSSNLPQWLTLSPAGQLSGTPPVGTPANVSFNVTVTDSLGAFSSGALTLPVLATPGLYFQTKSPLPPATPNVAYSAAIKAGGGNGVFTITASGLPNWLNFNIKTGVLTGTPPSPGPVTFQMTVTDNVQQTLTQYFTLPVSGSLEFDSASPLPPASAGLPYSETLVASGGSGGYTWSAANLPAWLSLSGAGVLTGTPSQAGAVNLRITVKDSQNNSISQTFALPVVSALTIETTSPLPPATMSFPYTLTFSAAGGAGSYVWSSQNLPSGFTLSAAGVLLGTPQAAAPLNFSVQVNDAAAKSATLSVTLPVNSAITLNSAALPVAVVQVPFSANLTASGGVPGYTFTATGAPAWLTLTKAGFLNGTPTSAGPVTIQVTINDSSDGLTTVPVTITVNPALSITTQSLPAATAGLAYSTTVAASGGIPPYLWSSTNLPAGLSIGAGGVLSGTPAQPGSYSVEVTVWDSGTSAASQNFNLVVASLTPLSFVTPLTLPTCVPNAFCSNQIAATGGVPPYQFSVPAGANLNGLSLSASGLLSGTPASGGAIIVPVTVSDRLNSISATFTQPVVQTLVILTNSLNNATVGVIYGAAIQTAGGQGLFTFSMAPGSGPLPPGLSLDTHAGNIFGTPTTAGTYTFSLQVTDGEQVSPPQQFTLTVVSPPTALAIATAQVLLPGTVGILYNQSLAASGGSGGYSWTLAQNSVMPAGLSLAPSGAITGTPIAAGNTTFTATVTDSSKNSVSAPFTITIVNSNTVSLITPNPLPDGSVGVVYSYAINVVGGTPPYFYSITGGQVPPGVVFNSTNGTFTGTPTLKGAFGIVLNVTDSSGASVGAQSTGAAKPRAATTSNYVIQIAGPGDFQITTQTLPPATLQQMYTTSLKAANGAAPYTWSLAQGAMPAGLILAPGGTISGFPQQAGLASIVLEATDTTGAVATRAFELQVVNPAVPAIDPVPAPPPGTVGVAYTFTLTAAGGHVPYTWSIPNGALPPGISLDAQTGALGGTPGQAGNFQFTAEVTDNQKVTATQAFNIPVNALTLQISPAQIPIAISNVPYALALAVAGGTPPYSWSLSAGGLLSGFTIDPTTGAITGTPTTPGTYPFTISVVDSNFGIANATFQLTVQGVSISITTSSLPAATVGTGYDYGLLASNSAPPLTWSVASGNLPAGIQLGTSSGVLSGTPTTAGSYTFTVQVVDSTSATATASLTLAVNAPPLTIATATLPGGSIGTAYSQTLKSSGGTGAITWSVSAGSLPGGLALSSTTGTISGTPSASGSFSFTIQATDSNSVTAQQPFTVAIAGPPALPAITLTGLPATSKPGDQPTVTITLSSPYSLPINVTATLSITPNPGNTTDLSFPGSSVSRTTQFTIPANTTTATQQFQVGTLPGTIEISLSLSAGGVNITPAVPPSATTTIAGSAPTITSVTVTIPQAGGGINVVVVGTSTTLDMKTATFQFTPAAGANLQTTSTTIDVSSLFAAWYGNSKSLATGSQFSLTIPFTVSGNVSDIASVSVTLTNSAGTSATVSANVP